MKGIKMKKYTILKKLNYHILSEQNFDNPCTSAPKYWRGTLYM